MFDIKCNFVHRKLTYVHTHTPKIDNNDKTYISVGVLDDIYGQTERKGEGENILLLLSFFFLSVRLAKKGRKYGK